MKNFFLIACLSLLTGQFVHAQNLEVKNKTPGSTESVGVIVDSDDSGGALMAYPSTFPGPFSHFADRLSIWANGFTSSGLDIRADNPLGDLRFYSGGLAVDNERMRITSSGRIGIGKTNPAFLLDLFSTSADGIRNKTDDHSWLVLDKGTSADNCFVALRSGGSDKWIIGNWSSTNDFYIRNWGNGGSTDNTFMIDDQSSAIGLNTDSPYDTDMFGMYPEDEFRYGIYYLQDRTTSGAIYAADFIINNSYSGTSSNYGVYSDVEKDGASNGSIYAIYSFANDDQTGTDTRYIRGLYASATCASTTGNAVGYGVYGSVGSTFDERYGVYYSGNLAGSGTKSAVVRTDDGPKKVYCQESPGNWFEDFGSGTMLSGEAYVEIPEDYMQTVTISDQYPMKVFITPNANFGNWWVTKSNNHFIVHAPGAMDGSTFDFRVVARRKGYEDIRLDSAPGAYSDHELYPDISEVPMAYRADWIRMVAPDERDPAWLEFVTPEDRQLLEEEIRKERVNVNEVQSTQANTSTSE